MSRGPCDGCGEDRHLELVIVSELPKGMLADRLQFCQACGAFVAGWLYKALLMFRLSSSS
jgi:hypothetical protein